MKSFANILFGFGILGMLPPMTTFAGTSEVKDSVYVGEIRTDARLAGFYSFTLENNAVISTACTNNTRWMWPWAYGNDEGNKGILSTLLTAKSMHMPIGIVYSDSAGDCRAKQVFLK